MVISRIRRELHGVDSEGVRKHVAGNVVCGGDLGVKSATKNLFFRYSLAVKGGREKEK